MKKWPIFKICRDSKLIEPALYVYIHNRNKGVLGPSLTVWLVNVNVKILIFRLNRLIKLGFQNY